MVQVLNLVVVALQVLFCSGLKLKHSTVDDVGAAGVCELYLTTLDRSQLIKRQSDLFIKTGQAGNTNAKLTLDENNLLQTMRGYGGALTQSSAYLFSQVKNTNNGLYWDLLHEVFDPDVSVNNNSASMKALRLPITGSDFTVGDWWTFDDCWDGAANCQLNVNLAPATKYILPVLKDILSIAPNLRIIGSPWSAPVWMKTSDANGYQGFEWGELDWQHYETYANYLVQVLEQFQDQGVQFYGLTLQNEPLNEPNSYPVMRASTDNQGGLANYVGKALDSSSLSYRPQVILYDHNWDVPTYCPDVWDFMDQNGYNQDYAQGCAFHCYGGDVSAQSQVHDKFPNKEIHFTECSGTGASNFDGNMQWNTNNLYMGSVQNWASSVLHWNLALDSDGNPHDGGCEDCRGIVTINQNDYNTVYYNEEYYGLAMFGRFVSDAGDAKRVSTSMANNYDCVDGIAFKNTNEGSFSITLKNFCDSQQTIVVQRSDYYVQFNAPSHSLATLYWH